MIELLSSALAAAEPPPTPFELTQAVWVHIALGVGTFAVAGLFATLRLALRQSHPPRMLGRTRNDAKAERLSALLERSDTLATSASIFGILFRLAFLFLLFDAVYDGEGPPRGSEIAIALCLATPLLWFATEGLPLVLAKRYGDSLLIALLEPFHWLQWPLSFASHALEAVRRAFARIFGMQDSRLERQIVEGLREVIAESEPADDLDETERELIGNVMEFGDVDVAAVMTPRTEVDAVDVSATLLEAAGAMAESGHSRIPVYEQNLDTIVGTFSARDLIKLIAEGDFDSRSLRGILRPAFFVPETKVVAELLTEFRRYKTKLAIVLDEYGGTAGLVTLGDVLAEIVGEIPDEFDPDQPNPFRELPDGRTEVDATQHVTEVNEELELELPEEEDYETLAGFVLAQLGHFPKAGESFEYEGWEFEIGEASDRRVLKVKLRSLVKKPA